MSYGDRVRALALSFPETYEDSPWGHPVFKVGSNKMFAAMSLRGTVELTVKLTAEVSDDETLENALEWLRESYWLNAPAALRDAVVENADDDAR